MPTNQPTTDYGHDLTSAVSEAIHRLRFTTDCMLDHSSGQDFGGFDKAIVEEQVAYVTKLLEDSLHALTEPLAPSKGGR